ncbi:MAG: YdcF family protein [Gaiella sp.]
MIRFLVALYLLCACCFWAWAGFLLTRPDDTVSAADAVVVLAGNSRRLPTAVELVRNGVAPVLVVSVDTSGRDPARDRLCAEGLAEVEVQCSVAVPYSTRGEARMLARLVRERGWKRVAVVSSRYHLFRARRVLERCLGDTAVLMRGAPTTLLQKAIAVPLEAVKTVLVHTTRRSC